MTGETRGTPPMTNSYIDIPTTGPAGGLSRAARRRGQAAVDRLLHEERVKEERVKEERVKKERAREG